MFPLKETKYPFIQKDFKPIKMFHSGKPIALFP